jgi:hypothetical protein
LYSCTRTKWAFLERTARQTQQYGIEDWVRPVQSSSADDTSDEEESSDKVETDANRPKQARKFTPCKEENLDARHRSIANWINVTAGFIVVWLGATLILGATKLHSAEMMYCSSYGTNIAFVQNAIGRDAFRQIRQFIHFTDNNMLPKKGAMPWSPLQKVAPVLESITAAVGAAWILRKRICVDESMIKYTGRAILFIQYMPVKPIKHGIKVFALCCAHTGYVYHFEIYTGKESKLDGSPGAVVKRLLLGANIGASKGRILYTDTFTPPLV